VGVIVYTVYNTCSVILATTWECGYDSVHCVQYLLCNISYHVVSVYIYNSVLSVQQYLLCNISYRTTWECGYDSVNCVQYLLCNISYHMVSLNMIVYTVYSTCSVIGIGYHVVIVGMIVYTVYSVQYSTCSVILATTW
jgi:hypothetical protein